MSKSSSIARFDFRRSVSYDLGAKQQFHTQARRQLKQLAAVLGLVPGAYDLRSNQGGIAVSGEITMHGDKLYVQISQPALGFDSGILFRTCQGRRDYTGGINNFASLDLLHRPEELGRLIWRACHV
jgi:hypothetical protein